MPLLFMTGSKTRRKRELRSILGRAAVSNEKGKLAMLGKFLSEHIKAVVAALAVGACLTVQVYYFNRLTVMKQQVRNLRAHIEGALQMRQNTIPGLAAAVSRFISHERDVFLTAVKARENSLGVAQDVEKLVRSLNEMSEGGSSPGDLSRFMAVAENYPQLVTSEPYQLLIAQITDVEKQIYSKRIEYNEVVNLYNTQLSTFPGNLSGMAMGFRLEPYFEWSRKPEWVLVMDSEVPAPLMRTEAVASEPKE